MEGLAFQPPAFSYTVFAMTPRFLQMHAELPEKRQSTGTSLKSHQANWSLSMMFTRVPSGLDPMARRIFVQQEQAEATLHSPAHLQGKRTIVCIKLPVSGSAAVSDHFKLS
jgi:hypothetical protein